MTKPNPYSVPGKRPRDPRLDFFRGIGMFIIFTAHMPYNAWTLWIPARFGWSDATEIFVFCSGMASALAFGRVFREQSWWLGTARVAYRCWQVYWAHIGVFLATVALMVALDRIEGVPGQYMDLLGPVGIIEDTGKHLLGLLTLTFVPGLFDILPMYLVILCMLPFVVLLGRIHPYVAMAACLLLWGIAQTGALDLPSYPNDPNSRWFFNPFGWQLIFFTGFAFGLGWIKSPPIDRRLVILAIAFIVITIPLAWYRMRFWIPELQPLWEAIEFWRHKTELGVLRYLHFLCIAYLAIAAAGEGGRRLIVEGPLSILVAMVHKVGQQALAVFMAGIFLSRLMGYVVDQLSGGFRAERDDWIHTPANLIGYAILIGVAYAVSWFKSEPWRKLRPAAQAESARPKRAESGQRPAPAE